MQQIDAGRIEGGHVWWTEWSRGKLRRRLRFRFSERFKPRSRTADRPGGLPRSHAFCEKSPDRCEISRTTTKCAPPGKGSCFARSGLCR